MQHNLAEAPPLAVLICLLSIAVAAYTCYPDYQAWRWEDELVTAASVDELHELMFEDCRTKSLRIGSVTAFGIVTCRRTRQLDRA